MNQALRQSWKPAALIVLLMAAWEAAVRLFGMPAWLLPAPSAVWMELLNDWPAYSGHIGSTITLALGGFLIGSAVGLLAATVLHLVPGFREALYPLMILTQNIPVIVLAPLLVIWFGFGAAPKLLIIALVCFFPIAVSVLDGFRQTSDDLMHYMKMAGASRGQIFRKLEWPHALPSVFSGLKIAATYSVMGAVITEWLGAKKGIGVYMTLASSSFRTTNVFVAIFLVMALSLLFFGMIRLIEDRTVSWKTKGRRERNG